ncbi:hypothetical protein GPJ61_27710 [Brevibacillus formosus]|uniref:hypothetical protein n=1 Tax=Brevibacillus formosus TaxID=54913 RepID=UPI001CA47C1A|nr:hypothetical protein [Brevibacillus formosus]MBW5471577.1 hypothetical protein [Brevibacillus formosus]
MFAMVLLSVGLFLFLFGALNFRGSILTKKANDPSAYNVLRLREKSKKWFSGPNWKGLQNWYRHSGLSYTVGEGAFFLLFCLSALEIGLVLAAFIQHKAFFFIVLIAPMLIAWGGWYYVQHKIDKRKRILLSDLIHFFSRLADFVHYREVTDYEKIRRAMIGTRILHLALPSEVVYRSDTKEVLRQMEHWIAFDEERILFRNALQEALFSAPDEAEKSLMETVSNLRYRKTARWKKELKKIENLALVAPVTNAGVFALVMIVSLLTVIQQMMGW